MSAVTLVDFPEWVQIPNPWVLSHNCKLEAPVWLPGLQPDMTHPIVYMTYWGYEVNEDENTLTTIYTGACRDCGAVFQAHRVEDYHDKRNRK